MFHASSQNQKIEKMNETRAKHSWFTAILSVRGFFVVVLILLFTIGMIFFRQYLSLEFLAARESELIAFRDARPVLVFLIAFLIYVVVTGLSLPGALVLSVTYAWYFGFFPALILISVASTLGATIAFLLSRYLFREALEKRFGSRLERFNQALDEEGAFYLFTLRLIPAFPFFVINAVMGLTRIRTVTFWWVSQLGMLPGTILFVWFGSSFPRLQQIEKNGIGEILNWKIVVAFVLIGVFPLAVRKLFRKFRSKREIVND